jgi:sterol desaturase/sphingolipid hydroxylase (fatty acid hydroxylase superfamily)
MTRRDAGVFLWAVTGMLALWTGLSGLEHDITRAVLASRYGSVMSSGVDRTEMLRASTILLNLILAATGVLLLRKCTALANWLFQEAPAAAPQLLADSTALPESSANEATAPLGETAAGVLTAPAQDVGGLMVTAIGLLLIIYAVVDLSAWLDRRIAHTWRTLYLGSLLGALLLVALGWLLVQRRERIGTWILRRPLSPSDPAAPRAAGIRLFGLFVMLFNVPALVTLMVSFIVAAGAADDPVATLGEMGSRRALSTLVGLALFLGVDGLRFAWRRLRSRTDDDDTLDNAGGPG